MVALVMVVPVMVALVMVVPVMLAHVIAAPVIAAPVIAAPVIAAPVIAAPVIAAPVIAAPVIAAPVVFSECLQDVGQTVIHLSGVDGFVETTQYLGRVSAPVKNIINTKTTPLSSTLNIRTSLVPSRMSDIMKTILSVHINTVPAKRSKSTR